MWIIARQPSRETEAMQYINIYRSPLGTMTIASDGASLTGLWFHVQKYFAGTLGPEHKNRDLPIFDEVNTGWIFIFVKKTGSYAAAQPSQIFIPPCSIPNITNHTLRNRDNLSRNCGGFCKTAGASQYVCASGRRRGRPQSDFYSHPVPQGGGGKRQPDRLCRRH